jgi:aminomethyltransferase
MGEFRVTGPQAREFVQHAVTNDLYALELGQVMYTCMCYPHGGIVDDLLVYNLGNEFFLVVNASNIDKDFAHLKDLTKGWDVILETFLTKLGFLPFRVPMPKKVLSQMTDYDLPEYREAANRYGADRFLLCLCPGLSGDQLLSTGPPWYN